jgi:hypothetical protein
MCVFASDCALDGIDVHEIANLETAMDWVHASVW